MAMNMCRFDDEWLVTILLIGICKYVAVFTKYISSLSLSSLSKQLAEYADWVNTGGASAGVLSTPHRAGAAGFMLGAPAVDRGGRILSRGGAHEGIHYGLFFTWFVLLMLIMSTIVFSGRIRWRSTGSLCMCLFVACWRCFLSGCEGRCKLCVTCPL